MISFFREQGMEHFDGDCNCQGSPVCESCENSNAKHNIAINLPLNLDKLDLLDVFTKKKATQRLGARGAKRGLATLYRIAKIDRFDSHHLHTGDTCILMKTLQNLLFYTQNGSYFLLAPRTQNAFLSTHVAEFLRFFFACSLWQSCRPRFVFV